MSDVRLNGKRYPTLQAIDGMNALIQKIETLGAKNGMALTELFVNGIKLDIDLAETLKLRLDPEDIVEVRLETPEQMSYESLQVCQEMAELLMFDIKVATLQLWDKTKHQEKSLETLLKDAHLFLTLAARPIELLNVAIENLPDQGQRYLRHLDKIAQALEDVTLLSVHQKQKEACTALLGHVLPNIERWLSFTPEFAALLNISSYPALEAHQFGAINEVNP